MPLETKLSMTSPTLRCDFENYVDPLAHPAIKNKETQLVSNVSARKKGAMILRWYAFLLLSW